MRVCAYCGRPLVQRENEHSSKFATRETCNFGCGAHLGHRRFIERTLLTYGIDEAEWRRRREAGLCVCGKPVAIASRDCRRRKTCGSTECRSFAQGPREFVKDEHEPPWPVVTGPITADFSGQNVNPGDGGFGMRIVKADVRSYTGCSAAYAAGVA